MYLPRREGPNYDAATLGSVLGTASPADSGAKFDRDGCVFPPRKHVFQFGLRGTGHRPSACRTWPLASRLGRVAVLRRASATPLQMRVARTRRGDRPRAACTEDAVTEALHCGGVTTMRRGS